jgi:cyclophilin family peptidyl-prolyl cis-trans isomerase
MDVKGYVYVIVTKSTPDLVKVGFSLKDPELRAIELGNTGSPHPYSVAYEIYVDNPRMIEQQTHQLLKECHEGKEWFKCSVSDAVKTIKLALGGNTLYFETFKVGEKIAPAFVTLVKFKTGAGDFVARLDRNCAPAIVSTFVELIEKSAFENVSFSRGLLDSIDFGCRSSYYGTSYPNDLKNKEKTEEFLSIYNSLVACNDDKSMKRGEYSLVCVNHAPIFERYQDSPTTILFDFCIYTQMRRASVLYEIDFIAFGEVIVGRDVVDKIYTLNKNMNDRVPLLSVELF